MGGRPCHVLVVPGARLPHLLWFRGIVAAVGSPPIERRAAAVVAGVDRVVIARRLLGAVVVGDGPGEAGPVSEHHAVVLHSAVHLGVADAHGPQRHHQRQADDCRPGDVFFQSSYHYCVLSQVL
ncbi:MAG: hypothetical protein R6U93_02030 [Dehalococcoidia bacterium]